MKTKKSQFKSTCVFCGGKSSSDEHVFPQWLGRRLTYPCSKSIMKRRLVTFTDEADIYTTIPKQTNHHASSTTTRKVCKSCNGGWLSQIESKTMSVYDKIINYRIFLDEHEQQTLASWAYLLALKWDLLETQISGYSESYYYSFKKNKTPPANTKIWMGRSSNDELECYHRTAAESESILDQTTATTRATTLKIGPAVFFVLTYSGERSLFLESANIKSSHKLTQIHPQIQTINNTEPTVLLTSSEMEILTKVCGQQHDSDMVKELLGPETEAAARPIFNLLFNRRNSLASRLLKFD